MKNLFSTFQLGEYALKHRVVLPPLTRMRAGPDDMVQTPLAVEYYSQRTTEGGLLIAEATQISQQGQGYPQTPGIYTSAQRDAWKAVTEGVKAKGGIIFLQLWHVGRISHSSLQKDNAFPVAPSSVKPAGNAFTQKFERVPFETPQALSIAQIAEIVSDYRKAAKNAKDAGFHGVEIHAANGYLLQQFLEDGTNLRNDQHGGSIGNRARLLFEVIQAVADIWPLDKIGVRLAPFNNVSDAKDSDPESLYTYVINALAKSGIGYLHLVEPRLNADGSDQDVDVAPAPISKLFRPLFPGPIIAAGGFTTQAAEEAISAGYVDLVAFGRPFIANPDLPIRLANNLALNEQDPSTFYGGGAHGYTDYPALALD